MAKRPSSPPARKRAAPKKRVTPPTEEEIRLRAYHRYLERGGVSGGDCDDWLEAEKDLRASRS
jgi:hypothetical protein